MELIISKHRRVRARECYFIHNECYFIHKDCLALSSVSPVSVNQVNSGLTH